MDRLPPELILLIHQHLDPQSTFHLALMSRLIASHSCDALALHRRRAATYGTVSGLNASAVQAVMDDEALAWHVRCLELWDWRGGVDELRAYGYCGGLGQDDGADDAWTVRMRERVQDLPAVALALEGFQLPPDRDGLQVLLVLSCPRVRQLKDFRTMDRRADTVREIWPSVLTLASVVDWSMAHPVWPSSFASLRQLALGLPTDGQSERDWIPGRDILPLFMLPNLEAIYIRGLAVADDEMEAIDASREYDELPTASSPVRHVCIEAAFRDCAEHVIANIIRACGALETLVLSSCDLRYNFDWIPQELVLRKSSVKTFLPCGDVSRLRGYCGSTYGDMWKELRSLEVLPMELDELAFQAGCLETQDKNALRDGVATTFERMPGNIGNPRVLVLHGNVDPITLGNGIEQSRELIGFIDEGLARLIFAQRNFAETEDGDRTLKALYLDKAVDTLLAHDLVETRAAAFPKTREVAEQLRISLHCEEGALDRFANETCRPIFGVGLAFDRLY